MRYRIQRPPEILEALDALPPPTRVCIDLELSWIADAAYATPPEDPQWNAMRCGDSLFRMYVDDCCVLFELREDEQLLVVRDVRRVRLTYADPRVC